MRKLTILVKLIILARGLVSHIVFADECQLNPGSPEPVLFVCTAGHSNGCTQPARVIILQ